MSYVPHIIRLGNKLYKVAFPIYRPLYSAFKAYSDRAERQLLRDHLGPGSVVVDAGANIGIYSQFLGACIGPEGAVHSFEPSPENFAHLRRALADYPNVRINQLALSDKTGQSVLYVSDHLNVDHRAYATAGEKRKTIPIRSTTLDDYFEPGARVDLIKMDIQGYELHALRGAERVLGDNPKVKLLLEFWPYGLRQAGGSAAAFAFFLREHRFTMSILGKGGWQRSDSPATQLVSGLSYLNVFATRKSEKAKMAS